MPLEEDIQQIEASLKGLEPVMVLSAKIMADALPNQGVAPPVGTEKIRKFLKSAADLAKIGEKDTAQDLVRQAQQALGEAWQWLTITDFGISAFVLRTYMEKNPLPESQLEGLIRYYLGKMPHAANDRDKLDYLLLEYFSGKLTITDQPNPELLLEIEDLLEPMIPDLPLPEPSESIEKSLQELYSLRGILGKFTDFDKLVHARVVERARAIKIFMAETFYHPSVLPRIIHFNMDFRKRFDKLFHAQLVNVRKASYSRIEEAWEVLHSIQDVYEKMELPELYRPEPDLYDPDEAGADLVVGRPLETESERIPLDRLRRGDVELRKDADLQGIICRITLFVSDLPPEVTDEDTIVPLRQARLKMSPAERSAFKRGDGQPPVSASTIQMGLGLIAWLEEELAAYKGRETDRYLWKPHFDLLSHGVSRSVELLHVIRSLIHDEAPQEEATWFEPLVKVALRMGESLNHALPVFTPKEEHKKVS